jgi:hypothetical protein
MLERLRQRALQLGSEFRKPRNFIPTVLALVYEFTKGLFEHRMYAATNDFLDSHAGRLVGFLKPFVLWFIHTPLTMLTAVVCVLLIHSYVHISGRPQISAKFLSCCWRPHNPFTAYADQGLRMMKQPLGPTAHDFLYEIYIVNLNDNTTTIQRIEAEIEIDGKRIPLKDSSLEPYELSLIGQKEYQAMPIKAVIAKKAPLESLWSKIDHMELKKGIGYRGWLAFQAMVPFDKLDGKPFPSKLSLIDAMDGRHPVRLVEPLSEDSTVTYVPKQD